MFRNLISLTLFAAMTGCADVGEAGAPDTDAVSFEDTASEDAYEVSAGDLRSADDYGDTYSASRSVYKGHSYAGKISSSADQDWFFVLGTSSVNLKATGSYISCTIYAYDGFTARPTTNEGSCTGAGRTVGGTTATKGHWIKVTGSRATSYTLYVK
jgi:hypothetical protein